MTKTADYELAMARKALGLTVTIPDKRSFDMEVISEEEINQEECECHCFDKIGKDSWFT